MRSTANNSGGAPRAAPASTRPSGTATGAASRAGAGARRTVIGSAASPPSSSVLRGGLDDAGRRPTCSSVSGGATGTARLPPLNRQQPVASRTSRSAVQADMDALADDYYGGVPSRSPAAHATTSSASSVREHYCKTDARAGVTQAVLRSQTTWYDGPTNVDGRSFDASDSNLLCMDVLAPPLGDSKAPSLCVVGSADHGLKVFDLASMRELKTLYTKTCGHSEWVTACRFLSDRRVLSGGMDSKLCLWSDVTRGGPARCADLLGHTASISQVEVNEMDGRAVALSASYDRTIRIWELSAAAGGGGRSVGCLAGHKGPVTQFSWRAGSVVSGDRQGTVKLWDVTTAQCVLTASSRRGQIGSLGHLVHEEVGHLVMFGDQGGAITVLDTRAPPKSPPVFQEALHPGGMVTFLRSPSPSAVAAPLMVSCGADKRIVARDARQGYAEVYALRDHNDFVYSMEVLGDLLLSGAGNGRVLVHRVATGDLLYELTGNAAAVREMFPSPGRLVCAGDDGKAKVFDFA